MHLLFSILFVASIATSIAGDATAAEPGDRYLYLIRHGQYDHEDPREPDVGKSLVPLGVAQSRLIAARLRALPRIHSLTSSTLTRARETARVIGEDFPELTISETPILSECTPTTWREDIMAGEDPDEVEACEEQVDAAFGEFFVPSPEGDRHDVLVCHGNVIRYLVTRVLKVETASWLQMSVGNCSLTLVRIRLDGGMKLLAVGDVGHLPPNLQTGLVRGSRALVVPESGSD